MSGTIIRRSVFGVCILFTAILLLYLIAAANNGTIKYVTNNDIQLKIYRYYGAAGCIDLMDKNNIPVDEEYRKNAKNDAAAFISYTDLQKVGSSDISKLICIDSVFGLDLKDELFTELHRRYNKDARLFDENLFDNYSELDDDTKLALQLTSTDEIWRALDSFGLTDEEYNIKQILADGFNNNLDKYDHNDIYNGKISVSSELENIFYYYLCTDSLSSLNYQKVWDVLGPGYQHDLFESNENKNEFNTQTINNLPPILTDNKAFFSLGAKITPKYTTQQYFNSLNTPSAFEYDPSSSENSYFEYTLFTDICQPKNMKLSENKFFRENINTWLIDNRKNFWD